jgi:uncharacterized damage-inducible protein DinB
MKESLLRLQRYNAWANARFIEVLGTLSEAQLDTEIISSFSSIRKTVQHTWGAEDIWLQRLQRVASPVWNGLNTQISFSEVLTNWRATSESLIAFAESLDEAAFSDTIHVVSLKGATSEDVIADVLQHVANHGSYHRGQLVTMLRQLGFSTIPQTDFIAYARGL